MRKLLFLGIRLVFCRVPVAPGLGSFSRCAVTCLGAAAAVVARVSTITATVIAVGGREPSVREPRVSIVLYIAGANIAGGGAYVSVERRKIATLGQCVVAGGQFIPLRTTVVTHPGEVAEFNPVGIVLRERLMLAFR